MATSRLCSIPDCGKPVKTKGYCRRHYLQFWRKGDALYKDPSAGKAQRFLAELLTASHDGQSCIFWPFRRNEHGYGVVRQGNKTAIASRVICEAIHGMPATPEHQAAHSCGNGHLGCVNPLHLSWKTHTENQRDRFRHGTHCRGERSPTVKLTRSQVREIRALKGLEPALVIAQRYGVGETAIKNIFKGKTWSWLPD